MTKRAENLSSMRPAGTRVRFRETTGLVRCGKGLRFVHGFLVPLGALIFLVSGCVSEKEADERARLAFEAGVQQGMHRAEAQRTQVLFRGAFQKTALTWRPDLTLSKAIVEAVYTSPTDPGVIVVMRGGAPNFVDPKDLLRGVDFLLEPGDEVVVQP